MWNTKSICLFLLGFIGVGTVEGQTSVDSYEYSSYVDPRIGSEGLGRVFIGPSCPYGMVKPSPDCTPSPNSGWLPMPERVDGFAQVHVSGTGGGPKYGNVLVTPFGDGMDWVNHYDYREYETIRLGYYDTQFKQNGIRTEITTANRASFYRFTYPIRQSVRTACPCTTGMPLKIQVNIFFSYASYLSNPSSFPQFPGFFPIFNTSSPPAIISL